MIDVVIVSNAKTVALKKLTQQTIDTARQDEVDGIEFYVVEKAPVTYRDAVTLHYDFEFGYNKCLNFGAKQGSNEYILFCNNDLIFENGWSRMVWNMKKYRVSSISPICPKTAKSDYGLSPGSGVKLASLSVNQDETRRLFAGWCFMWPRAVWNKLGWHDERRKFWTADNASLQQLKKAGLRHGLDTTAIVHHLQSQTLDTLDSDTRFDYEWMEAKRFGEETGKYVFDRKYIDKVIKDRIK